MRGQHTPVEELIALGVAVLYFFAAVGPLDALRSLSFRFTIGPQPAFAQGNANVSVNFSPGLNLFSFPVTIPSSADSCFELLSTLGGPSAVESISRFNTATQLFEVCGYSDSTPLGENFVVRDGEGYQIRMKTDTTASFEGSPVCPTLTLTKGTNIVGIPTPPAGLSCFDLLNALGAEKVATSQGYNKGTGAFEACTFVEGGTPAGEDFPIIAGEAYVVTMRQDAAGINLNDTTQCTPVCAPPTITAIEPLSGSVGTEIAITGTNLACGEPGRSRAAVFLWRSHRCHRRRSKPSFRQGRRIAVSLSRLMGEPSLFRKISASTSFCLAIFPWRSTLTNLQFCQAVRRSVVCRLPGRVTLPI